MASSHPPSAGAAASPSGMPGVTRDGSGSSRLHRKPGSAGVIGAPHIKRMTSSTVQSLGATGYRAPVSGQRRHGEGDGIPEDAEHSYHHEEYHHGHQQESDSIYAELERLRAQVNQLQRQADTFGKYGLRQHISQLNLGVSKSQPSGAISDVHLVSVPNAASRKALNNPNAGSGSDAMSLFITSEERLYEGWCLRKGGQFGKTWKRRYIVLYRDRLDFYDKEDSPQPRFQLPLLKAKCRVVQVPLGGAGTSSSKDGVKEACISITQADGVGISGGSSGSGSSGGKVREYFFYSERKVDTTSWFGVLRHCVMAQNYLDSCTRNNHAPDRRIVKFLTHGSEAGELDLSDRPLDDDVVKIVAEVILDGATPVKSLNLSRASLSSDQASTVVEAIMQSQHCMITRFNASGNRCGLSPFVPLFAADSLRDLILEDCNIDDNDLLYLSKYLHQLQQQKVTSDNSYNLTADELRERERQLSAAAAAAEAAAEEEALKSGGKKKGKKGKGSGKSSSSSGGGGAGSAAVGSAAVARPVKILTACALQQVDLSMNPIGDIGVEALLSCLTVGSGKSLVYLGLNSCQFGDHAAQQICDSLPLFPSLIYLQLRANRIGNEGAVAFSKALLNDKNIVVLDLEANDPITRPGVMALSHMALQNDTLRHLSFANHQLNQQGLSAMRLLYRHGLAPANQL